ncbi:MAG: HEAT repeat domain-containing protein [Planctomycetes bacterium]|nr:HEAT repeat domain-containing protein [Planctomycetota bacterium]
MTVLSELMSSDMACRLGWTLLHSVWQCVLVAAALALVLKTLRRSANTRYVASCIGMAIMLVAFVATLLAVSVPEDKQADAVMPVMDRQLATPPIPMSAGSRDGENSNRNHHFATEFHAAPGVDAVPNFRSGDSLPPEPAAHGRSSGLARSVFEKLTATLTRWLPWIALAWLVGVLVLSLWNVGGWLTAHRLRLVGTSPVSNEIAKRLRQLAERMRVARPARLLRSTLVEVPAVVGWFRPTILLPIGLITGLMPSELDAILIHELAHIRRYDYLVNLFQRVIETLLFYHPAVWWISRRIRIERENCCDDWVVAVTGDSLSYARTLTRFGELRHTGEGRLSAGQAISVDGGSLSSRVRRLLPGAGNDHTRPRTWLVGVITLALLIPLTVWLASASPLPREEAILANTPKLQERAKLASSGALGCGVGRLTLITSKGQVEVSTGLDPMHVFGNPVRVSDLLTLLRARVESNKTGVQGPMSGDASDLCYVCLYTLSFANDPKSVPVIAQLLTDDSDVTRGWAAIALYDLGDRSEALRAEIKKTVFPKAAVDSAAARGRKPPAWVRTANDLGDPSATDAASTTRPTSPATVSDRARELIPRLLERMSAEDALTRAAVVDELVVIRQDDDVTIVSLRHELPAGDYQCILQRVLPGLIPELGDVDLKRRLALKVCHIAEHHRLKGMEPAASEILKDPDPQVKSYGIQMAQLLEARNLAPLIAACLSDASLAYDAVRVLVAFRSPLVKPYLIEQLQRGPKANRHEVVQDLASIGATDAVVHLEPLLRDPSEDLRVWTVRALATLGAKDSRNAVFEAMVTENVHPEAVALLLQWQDERGIPVAMARFKDARQGVRKLMADALADYQATAIVPSLIYLLDAAVPVTPNSGTDLNMYRDAIVLVTQLRAHAAIPTLRRILNGNNDFLAAAAGSALASLGDEGAIRDLMKQLSGDYSTWTAAASALAQYGKPETAAAVIARLRETDTGSHRVETLGFLSLAFNPKTCQRLESVQLPPGEGLAPEAYAIALRERIQIPVQISVQAREGFEDAKVVWPAGSAWHAVKSLVDALNYRSYRCSLFIDDKGAIHIVTNGEAFGLWEARLTATNREQSNAADGAAGNVEAADVASGDPELGKTMKQLVTDALAPLKKLEERAAPVPGNPTGAQPAGAAFVMPDAAYKRALDSYVSSGPRYVLVTVVNSTTGERRLACIEPEFLLSAIHKEKGLTRDEEGWKRSMAFALDQKDRTFRFSDPEAYKQACPRYTPEILAEVQERVKGMTTDEIVKEMRNQESALYRFCFREKDPPCLAPMAHVLMERGIACGRGCKPGLLDIYGKMDDQHGALPTGQEPSPAARKLADSLPAGWRLTESSRCAAPEEWSGKTDCEYLRFVHDTLKAVGFPRATLTLWLTPRDYVGRHLPHIDDQPGGAWLYGQSREHLLLFEIAPVGDPHSSDVEAAFQKCGFARLGESEVTPAAEAATNKAEEASWGEPVEGVQARLRPVHPQNKADTVIRLAVEVCNHGQRDLTVAQAQELCELEIDGRRYRWAGHVDVKSSPFPPGRHYDNIQVSLVKDWKCGDEALMLKPGKDSVRVWFVAQPAKKDGGKPVRFATNFVEIVPDDNLAVDALKELGWQPMEKGNLVWDSNGRVVSIELYGPSRDVPVTDAWLVPLKGMTELRSLFLANTHITDAGLANLRGLTNLQELRLQNTRIGDAGLAHLAGLTKLEWLELTGTQVTDAGLAHLERMANLKSLFLSGTKVTEEGVKKLTRALPSVAVDFDAISWGEAVNGLQLGLAVVERPTPLPLDRTLKLGLHVRNVSENDIYFPRMDALRRKQGSILLELSVGGNIRPDSFPGTPQPMAITDYITLKPRDVSSAEYTFRPNRWNLKDGEKASIRFVLDSKNFSRAWDLTPGKEKEVTVENCWIGKARPGVQEIEIVRSATETKAPRRLPGSTRAIGHEMARSEFAFAAVCEAAGSGTVVQVIDDGGTAPHPVYETVQEYNVRQVLAGQAPPEGAIKLQYSHRDTERCRERAVAKGERVIWLVCRFDHIEGKWYGVKALDDTPENRKAVGASEAVPGEAVHGLRCSVGVQENSLRVGDEIRIDAKFENVSDKPVSFPYPPDYAAKLLLMLDEKGRAVESRMTGITEGWMHNKPFRTLQPGESFAVAFTGKIAFRTASARREAQPEPALSIDFHQDAMLFTLQAPGSFTVALRLAADDEAAARLRKQGLETVWQGSLSSNVARFEVKAATREELDAAIAALCGEAEAKRRESIRLLGAHMDTKAVSALMDIVLKGPPELRADAAAALGAIGDSSIVPALVAEYRRAGSVQDRQRILGIIEAASDWTQQWPLYLEIARSGGSHEEASHACSRLADLGRPEVVPVLVERAKGGVPMVQRGAIGQIAQILEFHAKKLPGQTTAGLKDELIGILKRDRDDSVRSRAATALAKATGEDVVPALLEALKDPDAFVGSYAAHSLGRIAGPEAISGLEAYIQTAPRESQKRAAQEAIERIRERAKAATQPAEQPPTGSPAQPGAAGTAPDAKSDDS